MPEPSSPKRNGVCWAVGACWFVGVASVRGSTRWAFILMLAVGEWGGRWSKRWKERRWRMGPKRWGWRCVPITVLRWGFIGAWGFAWSVGWTTITKMAVLAGRCANHWAQGGPHADKLLA